MNPVDKFDGKLIFETRLKMTRQRGGREMEQLITASQLFSRTVGMKTLPTISVIVSKALSLTSDFQSSIDELEKVIEHDQSMAAKLLGLANSAYYSFEQEITSVKKAIIVIGFSAVRALILGATIFASFPRTKQNQVFDTVLLWKHSVMTAECARALSDLTHVSSPEVTFICGLLHDIGKVALLTLLPVEYNQLLAAATNENQSLLELEREALEADHAEVGHWLAEKWRLPKEIGLTIRHHHDPDYLLDDYRVIHLVAVADYCAKKYAPGTSGDPHLQALPRKSLDLLGISDALLEQVEESLIVNQEKIEQFFVLLG